MIEYQRHLEDYKSKYYLTYTLRPQHEWGNKTVAEAYLDKYWLNKDEYENFWLRIKNSVFNSHFRSLPDKVFKEGFELIPLVGGVIFSAEDFEILKNCLRKTGDKHFVIIQNTFGQENPAAFRMKYPVNTSWNELMSGNYISTALFEMFHEEYFVFGDSGVWGKYVANDESPPLDIIGARHEYIIDFTKQYSNIREAYESQPESTKSSELISALPDSYKTDYILH